MVDTLTILAHGDSDGVASAALALGALREKYDNIRVFFTHPVGLYEDFKEFAKGDVIIVDIALNERHAEELLKLFNRYPNNIIYIDHHPPPLSVSLNELRIQTVREESEPSASELTYKKFREFLPRDYDRIALYGAIGDYADQTPWVRKSLEMWDKRQIYFEAGVLVQGLEGSRKMHDFKRHVVEHLSRNLRPSQLSELMVRALIQAVNNEDLYRWVKENVKKNGAVSYVINPPGSLGIAATYSMGLTESKIGIAMETRKDTYVMSLRTTSDTIDLNKILRRVTLYLGGSGGGHKTAAGARIPAEKFSEFIQALNEYLSI